MFFKMNKNILSKMLVNLCGKITKNETDGIHINDCENLFKWTNNKTPILY